MKYQQSMSNPSEIQEQNVVNGKIALLLQYIVIRDVQSVPTVEGLWLMIAGFSLGVSGGLFSWRNAQIGFTALI